MNKTINSIKKTLKENAEAKRQLNEDLIKATYAYLKTAKEINIGDTVQVNSGCANNTGIFTKLRFEWGDIRAVINKIKKDGTAHATATIYCYEVEDMEKIKVD